MKSKYKVEQNTGKLIYNKTGRDLVAENYGNRDSNLALNNSRSGHITRTSENTSAKYGIKTT